MLTLIKSNSEDLKQRIKNITDIQSNNPQIKSIVATAKETRIVDKFEVEILEKMIKYFNSQGKF